MTKYQPPRKGKGKKKVAPKKAVRSKPIPQQVAEQSARKRALARPDDGGSFKGLVGPAGSGFPIEQLPPAAIHDDVAADGSRPVLFLGEQRLYGATGQPVWDERDYGVIPIDSRPADDPFELPAPKPPGPLSKFWRQYQDEEGRFIGWAAASKLTKLQVTSRLRPRKTAS